MSAPLIECVPNISEGRDGALIDQIAEAVPAPGVALLDRTSDPDHHRTVLTFAGTPDAVEDAMMRVAGLALEHIDLEKHQGVHPRIGAVDVVPFVPLRGISLAACAERARAFARRYADRFSVPVYLYEASALRPERVNLPNIRRGGYEALKKSIAADPDRTPDYGPAILSGAGASVIGARSPLIAFNAFLDTADIVVARAIAKGLRASSGGLPYVRAIGVVVRGRAQVSINVIDFRRTSMYTIMRMLQTLASAYRAAIVETELIGLIPQAALLHAAAESLQLPPAAVSATLERRLGDATADYREVAFE
ncbi:MAG: glutamate formimidoyltransferase [Anaerolineae bacterium]|nr:glutamate formimidoyltransferase [Anaerolineae bacterium]NUQ02350.1 glutamate formimidoyltransferase [Anaerolineae bacterium]